MMIMVIMAQNFVEMGNIKILDLIALQNMWKKKQMNELEYNGK